MHFVEFGFEKSQSKPNPILGHALFYAGKILKYTIYKLTST